MPYNPNGDTCLSIWASCYGSGWTLDFPRHARVLEVGCAEADWQTPMLDIRPDLQITGIDWRACTRPGTTIQGDVLTQDFPDASFDAVVGISSIEHIGLGHYEADPKDLDGDIRCMERIARWLAPGGWVYLDVPWNARGYLVDGTSHRVYDGAALRSRLIGSRFTEVRRWYADRSGTPTAELEPRALPGYDYVALMLRSV